MTLIERLERATEADEAPLLREAVDLAWRSGWIPNTAREKALRFIDVGAYLDAALTLVPEGWEWLARGAGAHPDADGLHTPFANVHKLDERQEGPPNKVHAAIPALALCIAALRARGIE